ncbi:DUF1570 domain-containing protein [Brevundimonas sp. NPDC092305]|uniref:DUF1570 domain-containing protein n=1 Tax=Brevundimonas sp. NPDC092305 TaxID=3363957 RepID=UPI00380AAC7D
MRTVLLAGVLASMFATPALADWRKAETQHLVVYGDGFERDLRDYAVRLERFDHLLRTQLSVPNTPGEMKLPVYLVSSRRELEQVNGGLPTNAAGFYSANFRDVRAVAIAGEWDAALFHEYAHHFMLRNAPGWYPSWLVEGFADFFMTASLDERGQAEIGKPERARIMALHNVRWLPMERVLSPWSPSNIGPDDRHAAYGQAWLFTHWLITSPERFGRLNGYLRDTSAGMNVAEAVQANFGMSTDQLERALKTYLNAGIRHAEITIPGVAPDVTVSSLPDSADDALLLYVNLRDGAPRAEGATLLTRARALSARRPNDPFTRLTLARAEILFGDPSAGEAALTPDLEANPNDVERLLLISDARITAGEKFEDPAERERLYRQARGFLQRAYAADPNDHRVYQTIAHSRRFSPDYPTENDVELWRRAVAIAPQIASNRPVAAEALLKHGRYEEADAIIRPLASNPHGVETPDRLQRILDDIAAQRNAASTAPPTS